MMNRWLPLNMNSPTSGLRLAAQALSLGEMRPGLLDNCGPFTPFVTVVLQVEHPPARSMKAFDWSRAVRKGCTPAAPAAQNPPRVAALTCP